MNIIVLFEVIVKDGKMEDYLKMAGLLKDSLANAEGFIRAEQMCIRDSTGTAQPGQIGR